MISVSSVLEADLEYHCDELRHAIESYRARDFVFFEDEMTLHLLPAMKLVLWVNEVQVAAMEFNIAVNTLVRAANSYVAGECTVKELDFSRHCAVGWVERLRTEMRANRRRRT